MFTSTLTQIEGTEYFVRPLTVAEAFAWTEMPDDTAEMKAERMGYLIATALVTANSVKVFSTAQDAANGVDFGTARKVVSKILDISGMSLSAQEQAEKN